MSESLSICESEMSEFKRTLYLCSALESGAVSIHLLFWFLFKADKEIHIFLGFQHVHSVKLCLFCMMFVVQPLKDYLIWLETNDLQANNSFPVEIDGKNTQ